MLQQWFIDPADDPAKDKENQCWHLLEFVFISIAIVALQLVNLIVHKQSMGLVP